MRDPQDARPKAAFAAQRVLETGPELAESHMALGAVRVYFDWDWPKGEKELRTAMQLSPGNSEAYRYYAYYLLTLGRFDEAEFYERKAQEFEPLSTRAYHDRAIALLGKRDYDSGIAEFQRGLDLNPQWIWGYTKKGLAYTYKRMYSEALAAAAKAEALIAGDYSPMLCSWQGYVYAASGDKERAYEALRRLEDFAKTMQVDPMSFATVYSGLRDKERTLKLLEETIAGHWPQAILLKLWPRLFYEGLESEPRYQALLKQMSLP